MFGAAILMDPFRDIGNLGTRRTKKFCELYEHLANTQPIEHEDDDEFPKLECLNQDDEDTIYSLCVTVAGVEIANYVREFLNTDFDV